MARFDYAKASGILLDACRTHGVWFDPDELRRVLEFIRSGGLKRRRDRHGDQGPPAPADPKRWRPGPWDILDIVDFILSW